MNLNALIIPLFLGELTMLKEKYASKVDELDVLRVELDEMKSRPSLLGACTSCPVLHDKLDVSLVYARSLEAQLKAPVPTLCSTCEMNAVNNMELAHNIDRLQDDNDELRQSMGWLSGHEPLLRMMIEAFKHHDGEALGANKVGEGIDENEGKIGDIPEPPKTHHKNTFVPKPNHLRNRLDTTLAPPVFPPQTDNFQKPIKFKSDLGNEFFRKMGEKPTEEKPQPRENQKPKLKPKPFHCEHCGKEGHLAEFLFRRKREERLARELENKDRLARNWCRDVRVWCVPFTLVRGVSLCLEVSHHIEKVVGVLGLGMVSLPDVPLLMANTSMGGTIAVLGP
jgi:hypothetical protein